MKSSCRRRRRINYVTVTEEPASCLLLLGRDKQKHLHINFSLWRHDLLMYLFVWINYYQNIFSSLRYLQRTCYATGIEKFNCNRNHLHMQNLTILCLSKKRKKYAHLNICKLVNPFSLCATTVASFTLSLILIFFAWCKIERKKILTQIPFFDLRFMQRMQIFRKKKEKMMMMMMTRCIWLCKWVTEIPFWQLFKRISMTKFISSSFFLIFSYFCRHWWSSMKSKGKIK